MKSGYDYSLATRDSWITQHEDAVHYFFILSSIFSTADLTMAVGQDYDVKRQKTVINN
jgi:hypothetical protein